MIRAMMTMIHRCRTAIMFRIAVVRRVAQSIIIYRQYLVHTNNRRQIVYAIQNHSHRRIILVYQYRRVAVAAAAANADHRRVAFTRKCR